MDPIANLLTIIRNAYLARKQEVKVPYSKIKESIVSILSKTGFIGDFVIEGEAAKKIIKAQLIYIKQQPILTHVRRVSSPSVRHYAKNGQIPLALNGRGLVILTTSKGLMTDKEARKAGIGGEIICQVW
jgi:small subunit ribosomal protein S8